MSQNEFHTTLSGDEYFLIDHTVKGVKTLPGVVYLEYARLAGAARFHVRELSDVVWMAPLPVTDGRPVEVTIALSDAPEGTRYTITSRESDGESRRHAVGRLSATTPTSPPPRLDLAAIRARCPQLEPGDRVYNRLKQSEVVHGPSLQVIQEIRGNGREVLSAMSLPDAMAVALDSGRLDPGLMDGALQTAVSLIDVTAVDQYAPHLPFAIDTMRFHAPLQQHVYLYATTSPGAVDHGDDAYKFDLLLTDPSGNILIEIKGFMVRKLIRDVHAKAGIPATPKPVVAPTPQADEEHDHFYSTMRDLLAECLLLEPHEVDLDKNMVELGIDSILGVEFVDRINGEFAAGLKATAIYEHPTLRKLSDYLLGAGETEPQPTSQPASAPQTPVAEDDLSPKLAQILADTLLLERDQISTTKTLVELGIDSILGVEFISAVNAAFNTALKATAVYEYPTLTRLQEQLRKEMPQTPAGTAPSTAVTAPPIAKTPVPASKPAPESISSVDPRAVAVVGFACKFPQAETGEAFWELIRNETDLCRAVPADHFDVSPHYDPDAASPGKIYCDKGYFLDDIDQFDALFFKISPREAESMDPQVRLLLETTWRAFEDAGCAADVAGSNTGVFVGNCFIHYYSLLMDQPNPDYQYVLAGNGSPVLSNRLSYAFDLKGPSLSLDTGCSSTLVALNLAVQSLRSGETERAVVAGAALNLDTDKFLNLCAGGALSRGGRIRPFDEAADGFVPGEAVAALVLKPLHKALSDGDPVHGVIKGVAVRHGGFSGGPTVPNVEQEIEVMEAAWRDAAISPESLSFYEAHGTGTKLGDPLEMNAFYDAVRRHTDRVGFCAVGTVKANIGHTEEVAGLAGIIKVLMMMRHQTLPGLPFLTQINPMIRTQNAPYTLSRNAAPWPVGNGPRRAAVSAFGLTGTLAHVVLEAFQTQSEPEQSGPFIITLSAFSAAALQRQADGLRNHLAGVNPRATMAQTAYTLQTGRRPMKHRLALVVQDRDDLLHKLSHTQAGGVYSGQAKGNVTTDVTQALQTKDLHTLAQAWVSGAKIPWSQLYSPIPRRVSLPGYSFDRQRYWVPESSQLGTLTLIRQWEPVNAEASSAYDHRVILPLGFERLPTEMEPIPSFVGPTESRFGAAFNLVLDRLRGLLSDTSQRGKMLVQIAVPEPDDHAFSGLSGLVLTARQENPRLLVQLLQTPSQQLQTALDAAAQYPQESLLRQGGDQLKAAVIREHALPAPHKPWRDGGVYLITGGLGGLGFLFARDIAKSVADPVLILTGRSPLDAAKEARLEELRALGCHATYQSVDVANGAAVQDLIRDISAQTQNRLHGVLHCAGVLADNYLLRKTPEEAARVLAPKVAGTLNLDRATAALDLDAFLLFSSTAGLVGNPGQGDYAAANAFMDAYAANRNRRGGKGRALSINWPFWEEGGMQLEPRAARHIRETVGATAMPTSVGLEMCYRAWAADLDQVAVFQGEPTKLRARLTARPKSTPKPAPQAPPQPVTNAAMASHENVADALKHLLGTAIRLDPQVIDAEEPLESYGIDSVLIGQLNGQLAQIFCPGHPEELSKTLFYEYQNLADLAAWFLDTYPEGCARWCGAPTTTSTQVAATAPSAAPAPALRDQPIAVIGMSGRYPKAPDLETFWDNLKSGVDAVTTIPEDRWPLDGFYFADPVEAEQHGGSYTQWGGFLDQFAHFDAAFFKISPRDAVFMDPQERLFLEEAHRTFEDAGYTRAEISRRFDGQVGVFAGITKTGFDFYGPELRSKLKDPKANQIYPHTSFSSLTNRVSWIFNLQGPSMPIDTMCSSSLVAIHEACRHLRDGECDMALAGGVNLYLHPSTYVILSGQKMLSPGGRCRSFGAGADGMVPGEGVGAVLLKPLSTAQADGDRIRAVIRASATNHGGKTNGYTVPNPTAQAKLINRVLERADLRAEAVSYIEAHGTGTELGDPIEITGLTKAFRQHTDAVGFCALGSAKSNIGHLESAAGIAALTKVILQMEHRQLVPTLHADQTNPNIHFPATPFHLVKKLQPWPKPARSGHDDTDDPSRIAGISSFGAGGANAHVLVQEYEHTPKPATEPVHQLIPLSAATQETLRARAQQLLDWVKRGKLTESQLADAAFTLQIGREAMPHRLAFAVKSLTDLTRNLVAFLNHQTADSRTGQISEDPLQPKPKPLTEDDRRRAVEAWLEHQNPTPLLEAWLTGAFEDWTQIHDPSQPRRRMGLPTYPFAAKRYWIPEMIGDKEPAPSVPAKAAVAQPLPPITARPATASNAAAEKPRGLTLSHLSPVAAPSPESQSKPAGLSLSALTPAKAAPAPLPPSQATKVAPPQKAAPGTKPLELNEKELHDQLRQSLAEALYMETADIDLDRSFTDMGLDSIVCVEWVRELNRRFKLNLTATKVYDHPSVRRFAQFLTQSHKTQTPPPAGDDLNDLLEQVSRGALDGNAAADLFSRSSKPINIPLEGNAGLAPAWAKGPQAATEPAPPKTPTPAPVASPDPRFDTRTLHEELKSSLAAALYMEAADIDPDRSFTDMGLDSIVCVEWVRELNRAYGVNLTATKVYDHPTISRFAAFLSGLQSTPNPTPPPAGDDDLEALLARVSRGDLDSADADRLFQELTTKEG